MQVKKEKDLISIGIWIGFISIASLFLVAHFTKTTILLLVCNIIYFYFIRKRKQVSKFDIVRYLLCCASLIAGIYYLCFRTYFVLVLFQVINFVLGFLEVMIHLYQNKKILRAKKIKCIFSLFGVFVFFCFGILLIQMAINPNYPLTLFRKFLNCGLEIQDTKTVLFHDKYFLTNDINYSDTYNNSYFDLYRSSLDFNEVKPVFIYLHGGGFVFGDKAFGNATSKDVMGYQDFIMRMVDEGYQVISVNYELAPDGVYPTPIYQMVELVRFLKEEGDRYGIDSEFLVLGGVSAGAHIVGQFALTQTSLDYALKLGVPQILTKGEIKGIYFGCGLLEPAQILDSNFFLVDHIFYQSMRVYFQTDRVEDNKDAVSASIIDNLTSAYSEVYVTDGNFYTFNEQAHRLVDKLEEVGVKYTSFILDGEEYQNEIIPHCYEIKKNKYAQQNFEKLGQFLRNLKEKSY